MDIDLAIHGVRMQSLKFRPFIDPEKLCLFKNRFFVFFENTEIMNHAKYAKHADKL